MSKAFSMKTGAGLRTSAMLACVLALSACAEGQMPGFLQPKHSDGATEVVSRANTDGARTTERDVESPEVFQTTEAGLWDGRPSLGGVWVAHPDVAEPERVIIRNETNGQFVIGALFKRERETPGPRLQVSSDAAASIGLLAGQPMKLNVVALRREEVAQESPLDSTASPALALSDVVPAAPEVQSDSLDPVVSGAASAIETASVAPLSPVSSAVAPPAPNAQPASVASTSKLQRPFIQIGIFSVEQNANDTAVAMRQKGMTPSVEEKSLNGKTYWRVAVGPAYSKDEQNKLLKTIKSSGFSDAYATAY